MNINLFFICSISLLLAILFIFIVFISTSKIDLFNNYNNVIFIHIPKAGGMSIKEYIKPEWYKGHITVKSIDNEHDYFKFTFSRNPWDRVVSAYNFLKQGGMNDNDKKDAIKIGFPNITFEQFIKDLPENSKWQIHLRPQTFWLKNKQGNIKVNFKGKTETMDDDWKKLCSILNIPYKKLKKNNFTIHDNYKKYYINSELINIVYNVYKEDIDYFNYTF